VILITGASGKTGRTVLGALVARGEKVRVLAHTSGQADQLIGLGACESLFGDMRDASLISQAVKGVDKVYHICPNVSPDEFNIGMEFIAAAKAAEIRHFVYHSVMHPQVEAMPHHWQKMRVEEVIFASGLPFTILQPSAYMQNILAGWQDILQTGVYSVPYSVDSRISVVDLMDVGDAAAKVLLETGFENSILECGGPQILSQKEVADVITKVTGIPVRADKLDPRIWEMKARQSGMNNYQVDCLIRMFEYYDENGLVGNSHVLESVIGKPARTLHEFLTWYNQKPTEDK
jgi:NAD(P)H dehydrogenase (quinone)